MKKYENDLDLKAQEAIQSCFDGIPFVRILSFERQPYWDNGRPDLVASIEVSGTKLLLVIETKNSGQPRLARAAVNQILRYVNIRPNAYGIFVAPYISKKASEIFKEAGVGYLDLGGNCYLSFGSIYVEREGKPNLFKRKNYLRSLFSPKAERILRVLLANPRREWKVKDLAAKSNTSFGQVTNVKKLLKDREWINAEYGGFLLKEPAKLLLEWSKNYKFKKNIYKYYYSFNNVPDIEFELSNICKDNNIMYALTAFSGAARYSPYVRYQRVTAYIYESVLNISELLNVKEVNSGANLTLINPYDEGVFYDSKEIDNSIIVSPIQIYLDLLNFKDRGEEAANFLLEKAIKSKW